MSASLVGSEMCIRDSRCLAPLRWKNVARDIRPSMLANIHADHYSLVAVSYTHLTLPTICSV
eukprot:10200958-Alexandrium_andersonii.AAC.1